MRNHLLTLASAEPLPGREVILERGDALPLPPETASFPHTAVLRVDVEGMAMHWVGSTGEFGLAAALGGTASEARLTVEVSGSVQLVEREAVETLLDQSPPLRLAVVAWQDRVCRHAQRLALCAAAHTVEARLAGLLGNLCDTLERRDAWFDLTQEQAADLLAVQRTTVNGALGRLRKRGFLSGTRGRIRVTNREGLLKAACGCMPGLLP